MKKPATFANRMQELLDIKQITKAELSRKTGISRSSITRYVKGDWEGKQDSVYRIAEVMNVSEAWLMGYDVPMQRTQIRDSNKIKGRLDSIPLEIQVLVLYFYMLNKEGQEKLMGYAGDLIASGNYAEDLNRAQEKLEELGVDLRLLNSQN